MTFNSDASEDEGAKEYEKYEKKEKGDDEERRERLRRRGTTSGALYSDSDHYRFVARFFSIRTLISFFLIQANVACVFWLG